jgi:hypothetical protein
MNDEDTKPWDGRPENPERDGWHWVETAGGDALPYEWRTAGECERGRWPARWIFDIEAEIDPRTCRYLGPCLLPADHAALLAERDALRARVEKLEAGIARAMDEAEDAGPKALKYVTQELRDALAAAPAQEPPA